MNTLDKGYPYVLVSRIGKGELSSLLPLLHFVEKEDAPVFGADVYKNIFKTAFTVVLEDGGQIGKKGKSIFKSKKHLSEEGRLAVTLVNATQKRLSMNSVRRYIRHVGLETCMKMNVGSFFDTETDCYQEALFVKLLSECLDCSVAKLGVEEPHLNYVNTMTDPLYTYFNTNPLAVITTVAATKKFREVRALPGSTFSYDDVTRRRRQYHKLPKKTFSYPYYSNPSYEPETGKDSFIKPTFVPLATPTPLIDFATRFGTNCTMRVPTLQSVSSSSKPLHAALKFLLESNFRSDKQWNYFVEEQYYLEFIRETRLFASYGGKTRKKYHTTGMYYEYDTAQSLLEVRVLDDVVDMACQWGSVWFQTLKGELYVCNLETRVLVDPHSVDDVGTNRITFDFKDTSASLKRIKAGFDNAVIFSNTDAVCMNGLNNYGQCLKPPCKKTISISFRTGRIPLRDIATGTNFGVAVYEDGVLGTWGVTKMIGDAFPVDKVMDSVKLTDADVVEPCLPVIHSHSKSTHLQDIKVDKVFAGYSHAAFISEEKKIYTWGCGKSGKLGHGTEEGQKYPKEIAFFEKIPVVTAALGMDSTAVISIEGKLYVFGGNSANEIGLLTIKEPTFKPTLVNLPQKAVSVATSGRSTWVLLVDGDLMACGRYPVCGVSVGEGDGFVGFTRIMTTYLTFGLATAPLTTALRCRQRDILTCFFGTFADEDMNFPFLNHLGKRPRKVVSGRGFYTVLSENFNLYTTARGSVDLAASQLHDPPC
ncbi:regulator of chromosome condensation [Angomonas deanei]|uniref:Regulator of chromosome condensation (RCC1) repeat, putative n=1 Tax=Angomonas deanei TaxID=59799 RepID=A0A7G2CAF6_9TRYP|nr:regulator of chromosome condensation [Angomonas deanei]CAD2215857.1 Regulator of chromosome condensation (RCC1) repeat, putative [Angomonas deanei]|eukprot:EPY20975.1 regulator of chromosome condensation [Angomonas deanei]